ncbi:hypothetical protein JD974_22835 [Chromobacterium haemolyticum]|uniref:Uncharacterized protein n=1 Tax=Chromobacterium haemolyticum TaxID=394935 RepID=A0ABS3GTI6_9NEIS|nr:hypothetical protein [Chromobacterium haemolyticum]MBK0417251.1 hypothetical protein [Chromobacterium haemolyticum]MBO0418368.1 hypothetical protein [Chromobacterium haemolyticum]MBO0501701.1 hypothetical protein [Chromobacterium haemolyticum]OQS35204.1 hypothetical protein B0T40_13720 [Chromobacterium haemolyticum]BBH14704.1 hypothetical protein CH06BL_39520 [Chromobacterium haemolyticum]
MSDFDLIIDTMLPGDVELGMPPASRSGVGLYFAKHRLTELASDFAALLGEVCTEKFGAAFADLDAVQRLQAINACKLANVRVFSALLTQVFRAYYTEPAVLVLVGAGSVPPFPNGNSIGDDDWEILIPVYERGQMYRETH